MSNPTHYAPLATHPDLVEMQARYERAAASGPAVITDGMTLLAGLWLAISPWVVGFDLTAPAVRVNNLVLGIAVAVIAVALTAAPQRMVRLSWATAALGAWVVVSQWIIQQSSSSAPIMINNVVSGALIMVLGVAAASILKASESTAAPRQTS
ncbi:SPW repeat protein [Actinoplanes teichomyceticus]|uniref:SPW repeat-containing protein n=1 Tax=Actinoplanes teichomyceticus TaxID=1867 RepID=A0A561WK92_ACTTI|nr:SPW repeat protein [Actinoplanes teichomyceticus]TWG24287.1 SPW repeat-containing protein [Actinoplanes teichomyceticus]GIF12866.1 membrane protein [Actinoplanes teichomyceticus]